MKKINFNKSESNSVIISPGVILNKYKIMDVYDHTDQEIGNKGFKAELCLELVLSGGKYTYNKYLFGNYEYNIDSISGRAKERIGWKKKGNQIYSFFSELFDSLELNDDYTIPSSFLSKLIGQEIYVLRYIVDVNKYKDFWLIVPATENNKVKLLDKFNKYVPKDYNKLAAVKSMEVNTEIEDDIEEDPF